MELGFYVLAHCNEHTPVYPDVVLLLVTDALAGKILSTSSTYYCWNKKPEVDEELPYEIIVEQSAFGPHYLGTNVALDRCIVILKELVRDIIYPSQGLWSSSTLVIHNKYAWGAIIGHATRSLDIAIAAWTSEFLN
uniref:Uncharacterized protein n=1 Tax=Solanum lycopersicum TaxID=4081 RepID=A0A3Q7J693_SOLLC